MSRLETNMQVQTPKGVAVTSVAEESSTGHTWWWVVDSNGEEDKFPEGELKPLHQTPPNLGVSDLRYEVSARTLKVEAIPSREGTYSLSPEPGIRVTHLTTGLVVEQTKHRSQHQNRDSAIETLKKRLDQLQTHETGES